MDDKMICPKCGKQKAFEGARLCPACTVVDVSELIQQIESGVVLYNPSSPWERFWLEYEPEYRREESADIQLWESQFYKELVMNCDVGGRSGTLRRIEPSSAPPDDNY